jgi:hypothetical protein
VRNALSFGKWKAANMGEVGNKSRKFRRRMPKVAKGAEPNDIHLAGLANSSGGTYGTRLDHELASGRSQNTGRFGRFVLRCLGRRPKSQSGPDDH